MNFLTIFNRESMLNIKKRKLLLSLSIAITFFAIIMLIVINNIIVEADIYSYINFQYVRMMIKFAMFFEIGLVFILSSIFLSSSINTDKNNLSLQNILCAGVKKRDIIYGKYINGVMNTSCIVFAGMPIAYICLFFGGFTITRIYKYLIILIMLILLSNAISIFISSKIKNASISLIISLSVLLIIYILLLFTIDYFMYRLMHTILFSVISLAITLLLLRLTENSKMFLI